MQFSSTFVESLAEIHSVGIKLILCSKFIAHVFSYVKAKKLKGFKIKNLSNAAIIPPVFPFFFYLLCDGHVIFAGLSQSVAQGRGILKDLFSLPCSYGHPPVIFSPILDSRSADSHEKMVFTEIQPLHFKNQKDSLCASKHLME